MIFTNNTKKHHKRLDKSLTREIKNIVLDALREDGVKNDVTSRLFVPKNAVIKAVIVVHHEGTICGMKICEYAFKATDRAIKFRPLVKDGAIVKSSMIIAELSGPARSILGAERVALNFLARLSGIADKTRLFTTILKPYKTRILDTRKTAPNLRMLEKYAVRTGGGLNHRYNLSDMVLIKENHIKVLLRKNPSFNLANLIINARRLLPKGTKIEVEAQTLEEFYNAVESGCDIIMLDNMSILDIRRAVKVARMKRIKIEVSGNITADNIRKIAACGVDFISTSKLNRYLRHLDISLDII